jgi:hypothetical protein
MIKPKKVKPGLTKEAFINSPLKIKIINLAVETLTIMDKDDLKITLIPVF